MVGHAGHVEEGVAIHPSQVEQTVVTQIVDKALDGRDLSLQQVIIPEVGRLSNAHPPNPSKA
jgi:hypothetical protein